MKPSPKKQRDKTELVDYDYLYTAIVFVILSVAYFSVMFTISYMDGTDAPFLFFVLVFGLGFAFFLIASRKYKLSFNRTGIVIRFKHGETLTLNWTEFEYCRLVPARSSYYVLLVRKGRLPDDLIPFAAMGEFPSDGVLLKYDLHQQVKRYYKGTVTREEFLDSDAYILDRPSGPMEKDWKKFNDVTGINKVVPRLGGGNL